MPTLGVPIGGHKEGGGEEGIQQLGQYHTTN